MNTSLKWIMLSVLIQNCLSDKLRIFNETFNRIAVLNFNLIADSIEKIIMQEGEETIEVTDREHIIEFLNNCEASIGKKIEEQSSKISTNGIKKEIQFICEDCEEVTESTIVLDPVNFFMAS